MGPADLDPERCFCCGAGGRSVLPLVELIPLKWDGCERVGCCEVCGGPIADVREQLGGWDAPQPQCLHLWTQEVGHWAQSAAPASALRQRLPAIRRRLGDLRRGRGRARAVEAAPLALLRQLCGCATCSAVRQPGGWRRPVERVHGAALASWHDECAPADRPPVPLADVTMKLVDFVKTLHPEQRVLTLGGEVMPAAQFVRTVQRPRLDRFGRPVFRDGKPVEDSVDVGVAIDAGRAETARPPVGPLAASAVASGPSGARHDWQFCRRRAYPGLSWDELIAIPTCPCGIGPG